MFKYTDSTKKSKLAYSTSYFTVTEFTEATEYFSFERDKIADKGDPVVENVRCESIP